MADVKKLYLFFSNKYHGSDPVVSIWDVAVNKKMALTSSGYWGWEGRKTIDTLTNK